MAKTNHIDSTGPAPISTNESTTVYRGGQYTDYLVISQYEYGTG